MAKGGHSSMAREVDDLTYSTIPGLELRRPYRTDGALARLV